MARFSQQFLAQTASPTFGRGLFDLAQNIGGLGAMRSQNEAAQQRADEKNAAMRLVNEARASNDPEQLLAASQAMRTIDPDLSVKLAQAAGLASQAQKDARKSKGVQGGLTAITQAASELNLARNNNDQEAIKRASQSLQQGRQSVINLGGSAEEIRDAVAAGIKPKDPSEYSFSEETVVVDGKPTRVQVAVNKNDPSDRKVYTIGEAQATGKTDKTTLGQLLKDAGFEGNLSTLEGVKKARQFALLDLSNASLAGELADLEKQMTPFSLQQSIETVRAISPDFEEAESMLEKTERYRALDELNDQDIAGLTALLERTITSTTENDLKAVAELSRFRSSKDLVQRIKDFTTMTISGELSTETLTEYRQIMDAVDALSRRRVLRAADQTILLGSEREVEAAKKVRKVYETEDNQARWVN